MAEPIGVRRRDDIKGVLLDRPELENRPMALLVRLTAVFAFAALIAGCSNPSADVTAARVNETLPVDGESESDLASPEPAEGETISFDGANSTIGFVGSKLVGGSHDGGFESFTGQFELDPETGEIRSVSARIDMQSIWSDNDKLTAHLKNEDFFEVETYPTAEFSSTSIEPSSAEWATHEITGDLTLHGESKSITFPATVTVSDTAVALDAEFKIDRTVWGIVYGAESDVRDQIINRDVVIRLDLDAPRGSAAEATE